jgi:hypothetical protein
MGEDTFHDGLAGPHQPSVFGGGIQSTSPIGLRFKGREENEATLRLGRQAAGSQGAGLAVSLLGGVEPGVLFGVVGRAFQDPSGRADEFAWVLQPKALTLLPVVPVIGM